jgi:RNA polymerase sigma-70 factor, ECF subfamily
VKKAQKGSDKAFLQLFQTYEEDVYRMAYVYVKNENDALDVVQEVAYKSFKKIHTLKEPQYFKTWLIKMTITTAINVIRMKKKVVPLQLGKEQVINSELIDIPLSLTLRDLLNILNEQEKSVVLLKYYNDFSFNEIAEVLELPLGTAKSLLYRALRKLRKELKEEERYEQ